MRRSHVNRLFPLDRSGNSAGNSAVHPIDQISRLQKQLSDQIKENVWKEKECTRLQERIKHLQENNQVSRRNLTRIEHAFVAITKEGNANANVTEISMAGSDADNDEENIFDTSSTWMLPVPSSNETQMQQLFMALQNERRIHQEEMKTLNTRINLLQKEKELSRAEYLSSMSKLQQQPPPSVINPNGSTDNKSNGNNPLTSVDTDAKPAPIMNTIMKDIADTTKISTISPTLAAMLDKYDELDEDSRKMLIQHAITTDNARFSSVSWNYELLKETKSV
jgi:hypothetical protein